MKEHPVEELLELFYLRRLNAAQMMAFLHHLDGCRECRDRLRAEREYIDAMIEALRRIVAADQHEPP